ncbi:uncharacterized protein LOC143280929 [Babylonia areolata]|uniref:uncharacterized protein LOC143280929 n=1 Tax=Babylonia areolata TaxID=304850 RepID=UPI003FD21B3F
MYLQLPIGKVKESHMAVVPSWDDFAKDHLLHSNLFSGVCLLSKHGDIVYTFGQLHSLTQAEAKQFVEAFSSTSVAANEARIQRGFSVTPTGQRTAQFKIYSNTFCNIYCTSSDNRLGLTVNKLPYGVLVCLYSYPTTAAMAVKQVELFCDKLRL